MALAGEQAWFEKNRAFIAAQYAGQFVLVKSQAVQGAFPSFDAAYMAGAQRFGAAGQFLVKQALPTEPKVVISALRMRRLAQIPMPGGENPSDLEIHGALVKVKVLPPAGSQGMPQDAVAMIDTGASISGVLPQIAQAAGGVQTSSVRIGGVVGSEERPIYAAALELPEYKISFDAIAIAGVDLPQQDIQFLIGRDMLKRMNLLYKGPETKFDLASPQPAGLLSLIMTGGVAALAFGSLFFLAKGAR